MSRRMRIALLLLACLAATNLFGGGPLLVGGPATGGRAALGHDGVPFTWNAAAMPIQYRVDPGPMAVSGTTTVIDNATGLQRLQSMFAVWSSVPTAAISFSNAGPILAAGAYTGGDVQNAAQFNAIAGSCDAGTQSPVIFDANGSIVADLGLPNEIIGFSSPCNSLDEANGFIRSALIVMNGKFQDGINTTSGTNPNLELTANEFDESITHEMGHFLGLDHSQINLDLLLTFSNSFTCDADRLAGIPLMFPIAFCQARKDVGLPVLAPDDVSWISQFYPAASQPTAYGTISGTIFFTDGQTQVQGVNVIAREVDDPATPEDESRRVAVSVVSGYRFTGNPGQSVTAALGALEDNTNGDRAGSRQAALIGFYSMKVPPGTYTIEVESIDSSFDQGSSVGPLNPPAAMPGQAEFWNKDESAFDYPLQSDPITVHAGDNITGIDIILNQTFPRFDSNEDNGALFDPPIPGLVARKEGVCA